jgi:hypothetical protein
VSRAHDALFASRPDLTPGQIAFLKGQSLERAAELLAQLPRTTQQATAERGGAIRASRSSSQEAEEIANRFGRALKVPEIHWEGNELVLPQLTKTQAAKVLASRGYELPAGRPHLPTDASNMADVRREIMTAAMGARGRVTE